MIIIQMRKDETWTPPSLVASLLIDGLEAFVSLLSLSLSPFPLSH